MQAVATAAGRDLQIRNAAADRHARFDEHLSPQDRALLQELERQRLAHVEGVDVTDTDGGETATISAPANGDG
jgi:hypothetical protein